ncbi:recombination exonuclease [Staphylococcus phage Stau2]|uniref:Exonuclease n=1 Tax=Staphylococcus phage Stau2 TaxID=1200862 RepID=A0A0U1ZYB2_9CAUD|nr:recombination exonuclease [Staphylococcus phage Stau2]AKA61317.1 exonuclease [Staphylococcus phage Stau2]
MKFIFFTDSHFHMFTNYSKPDEEYGNDRFKEQIETLQKVFDLARENKAKVIFGGDLFHKRNAVDTRVYNKVFETFAKNQDVKVYMVRGNHDAVSNSLYTESSIDIFETLPNVEVTKDLRSDSLSSKVQLTMCAYGDETEEIKEYIKKSYQKDKVNILVAHLGVENSLTGKGSHRLEGAFGYQDLLPEKYDFILLGHYHRRQYLNNNPNHMYGGSLMQQSFSDEQEANGVHLIDTDKLTSTFIPLDTRKFITVQGDNVPDNMNDLVNKGHFIRFIGTPEQAKVIELDKTEDESNVQVQMKKEYTVEKRVDADVSDSPITITSSYADKYYPEAKDELLECLKAVL